MRATTAMVASSLFRSLRRMSAGRKRTIATATLIPTFVAVSRDGGEARAVFGSSAREEHIVAQLVADRGQAPVPKVLDAEGDEKTGHDDGDASGSVDDVVVRRGDDGDEGEQRIQEGQIAHPLAAREDRDDDRTPQAPADVQARHRGVLVGEAIHLRGIERPQPVAVTERVDEPVVGLTMFDGELAAAVAA